MERPCAAAAPPCGPDAVLHGACFETDYASLCAWRDWSFPDRSVCNFFVAAALRAADGAFWSARWHDTAVSGTAHFPLRDAGAGRHRCGGVFDLAGNLRRELLEETGLEIGDLNPEPGWTLVRDRCYRALMRLIAPQNADAFARAIMRHIASQRRLSWSTSTCASRHDFDARCRASFRLFCGAFGPERSRGDLRGAGSSATRSRPRRINAEFILFRDLGGLWEGFGDVDAPRLFPRDDPDGRSGRLRRCPHSSRAPAP